MKRFIRLVRFKDAEKYHLSLTVGLGIVGIGLFGRVIEYGLTNLRCNDLFALGLIIGGILYSIKAIDGSKAKMIGYI